MNTITKTTARPTTVARFDWDANKMVHQYLRCDQHPDCRWLTKDAYARSIFYVTELVPECDCPIHTLIVE